MQHGYDRMRILNAIVVTLAMSAFATACSSHTSTRIGGETVWIDVAEGQLKTQVFATANVSVRPILILVLHGDIPNPRPDYQYRFTRAITTGFSEDNEQSASLRSALGEKWKNEEIVAAGILRPGYTDPSGDRSAGDMGMAYGDNYTPEVVDAVASATGALKEMSNPRAVVVIGHSGGGAITANLLGRYPGLVDGALLVGCGCDPEAWRSRMRVQDPRPILGSTESQPHAAINGFANPPRDFGASNRWRRRRCRDTRRQSQVCRDLAAARHRCAANNRTGAGPQYFGNSRVISRIVFPGPRGFSS